MDEAMQTEDIDPALTCLPDPSLNPSTPAFQTPAKAPSRGRLDATMQDSPQLQLLSHGWGFTPAPARTRPRAHDMFNTSTASFGLGTPSTTAPACTSGYPVLCGSANELPGRASRQAVGTQSFPSGLGVGTAAPAPPAPSSLEPAIKLEEGVGDTDMSGIEPAAPPRRSGAKRKWQLGEYLATKIKKEGVEYQDTHGNFPVFPKYSAPLVSVPTGRMWEPAALTPNTIMSGTSEFLSALRGVGLPAETDNFIPFNQERMTKLALPKTPSPSPSPELEQPKKQRQQTQTNCIPLEYNRLTGEKFDVTVAHTKPDSNFLSLSQKEKTRSEKNSASREPHDKNKTTMDSSPMPPSKRARRSTSGLEDGEIESRKEKQHRRHQIYLHKHDNSPSRSRYNENRGRTLKRREDGPPNIDRYRPEIDRYRPARAKEATEGNLKGLNKEAPRGRELTRPIRARSTSKPPRPSWSDHLRMGREGEGLLGAPPSREVESHFGALPGRDWVPPGFNSLAIKSPPPMAFDQRQPIATGFSGQFPFQTVRQFPQFSGMQLEPSGMLQCQQDSQFQFGSQSQQRPLYPPVMPDIRLALKPLVTYSPVGASDPAEPNDHSPGHLLLEWAGENQLRLHAMELIQTLGLGQPGQRCDLRGLASALVSDRTLSLLAAYYPLQVSIQAPRFFRAYIGAIIESNREASGLVSMRSQQDLRQWFFELFMPVIEDIAPHYTHQPQQKQKPADHARPATPRDARQSRAGDKGNRSERMEAVKRMRDAH
ncbi:hypothetical protein BZA05DRAFT_441693 [Tricharina praecox]|uniref:uncharacterized protein n=1 Tax=Tricharina praecox TaxID=43433 RepID=UPI00221F1E4C|nr:uncharacterized protein BZA05DRAFT_441693 [Tricharina praecox]KAI5857065.1 hypothetical protein BZA05DRAFT_441693 [Tricharina praecox]